MKSLDLTLADLEMIKQAGLDTHRKFVASCAVFCLGFFHELCQEIRKTNQLTHCQ